jgi:hypothetical protein
VFSVFCGFIVFPYIGYLAFLTGEPISQVIQPGQGLAFIVFPYAVGTLKGGPFWSICFFVTVLIIGMDNMMASVETLNAAITDLFPSVKKTRFRNYSVKAVICLCFFLFGLLLCSRSGIYWVNFFNQFSGSKIYLLFKLSLTVKIFELIIIQIKQGWGVLTTALAEVISVGVFYGFNNYRGDIFIMIGHQIAYNRFFFFFGIFWILVLPPIYIVRIQNHLL